MVDSIQEKGGRQDIVPIGPLVQPFKEGSVLLCRPLGIFTIVHKIQYAVVVIIVVCLSSLGIRVRVATIVIVQVSDGCA